MTTPRPVVWFSIAKAWEHALALGIAIGWGTRQHPSLCLIIEFGPWLAIIGPHYAPRKEATP